MRPVYSRVYFEARKIGYTILRKGALSCDALIILAKLYFFGRVKLKIFGPICGRGEAIGFLKMTHEEALVAVANFRQDPFDAH